MTSPADEVAKPEQALAPEPSTRLSTISRKYDTSGKGYLDKNEQKMREMDTSNRGYLTNDRVYQMMEEMNKKMVTMRKLIIGLGVFAVLLSLANVGTAFAAATLARDTTISSEASALTTKDGGDTVGTKPLPGMQFSVNNACTTVKDLAKAYKTIKEGSTVSLIESHEGQNEDGSTSTGESAKTVTEATSDGDRICLGSTCFILGIPCAGTSAVTEEEAGSGRRLARQKEIFERTLEGTHSFLRERKLSGPCQSHCTADTCDDNKCRGCSSCSGTDDTEPVAVDPCASAECGDPAKPYCEVRGPNAHCVEGVACGTTTCHPDDGCGNESCSCCGPFCTQQVCDTTTLPVN